MFRLDWPDVDLEAYRFLPSPTILNSKPAINWSVEREAIRQVYSWVSMLWNLVRSTGFGVRGLQVLLLSSLIPIAVSIVCGDVKDMHSGIDRIGLYRIDPFRRNPRGRPKIPSSDLILTP